jgi:endonuclease-3
MTGEDLRRRAARIDEVLADAYPDAWIELDFRDPYELLVATILSAQCTDARVNKVTPALFARYPDANHLARAGQGELEGLIRSTGFFRNKAKALLGMAQAMVERHGGEVPSTMDGLTALPGIGRKTANVVLGTAFDMATGIVVDTHVARVSRRLGLTKQGDPEKIERDLMGLFPQHSWVRLSHRLIIHGRYTCTARRPGCPECPLEPLCPKIGV